MTEPKHIISLGAGVQSSAMALMAAAGEITPMPEAAIFADTQNEPPEVYEHLKWLTSLLPFPVHITTAGNLSQRLLDGYEGARAPFYILGGSLQTRQCTREFKIRPIRRKVREIIGATRSSRIPDGSVIQWIGISMDEVYRMKPSGVGFMVNRWPLLEDGVKMSRGDCKRWLWERYRKEAPKSACVQCPYQPTERLIQLKRNHPDEWQKLCTFDSALRTPENIKRFRGQLFVHKSREPLVQIDFGAYKETQQINLFNNECEGMCGL